MSTGLTEIVYTPEEVSTRQRIEDMETAMLECIQNGENFGNSGDSENQGICMASAAAYGTAALVLRARLASGEIDQ